MKSTHRILIAIFLVLLSFSLVFTSCDETGDETTAADKTTEITTEETTPVESPDETTESPVQTTETPDETTAEVTEEKTETKTPETTAEPQTPETTAEVTTAPPAETTAEVTTAPPAETTAPIPEETTQAPHEHVWSAWTTVLSAACTTEGKQERTCACGEKETKTLAAVGHSEVIDKAVAATCTTDGKTEGKHCKNCGTVTVKQNTVKALGHTEVVDKGVAATCTTSGLTDGKHCKVCNAVTVKQNKINALGHTEVVDKGVDATCITSGLTEGKHCKVCNMVLQTPKIINALGHPKAIWKHEKIASTTDNGLMLKICTICNSTVQTITIPAGIVVGSGGLEFELNSDGESYTLVDIGDCIDTNIIIPPTYKGKIVSNIGFRAFMEHATLTSIKIPYGVTSIEPEAFEGCPSLESIIVDSNNPIYHSNGNCLIETESKTIILGCKKSVIPSDGSVLIIGPAAFKSCSDLTSITIPNGITTIDNWAFWDCYKLNTVTISNTVEYIGDYAFKNCSLNNLFIPESVNEIGYWTFSGCGSLESIAVSPGNNEYHSSNNCLIETKSKVLLLGCKNSVIPTDGSVLVIDDEAFRASDLTSIIIPDSITRISYGAFAKCTFLTELTISNSVKIINDNAFAYCISLEKCFYLGTIAEWEMVKKGDDWNYWCPFTVIHCSDGNVKIS